MIVRRVVIFSKIITMPFVAGFANFCFQAHNERSPYSREAPMVQVITCSSYRGLSKKTAEKREREEGTFCFVGAF
jgi:hypothetical protein